MSGEDSTGVRGIEMREDEVVEFLEERGHGTLSLATDGSAYAVPISFGYDGDRIYCHLIRFGDDSQKLDYARDTAEACLTVYEVDTRFEWRSVVVRGSLREASAEETDYVDDVMDDNAWVPSLFPPTAPMTAVERYVMDLDEATGRKGEAYQQG